jgi:1,4-alpha-glucan branching enzyme
VAIVGDFNGWDPAKATPLERMEGGLWAVTIALAPGTHTYAYLVNDTLTVDPRAPKEAASDFGRASSVILVPDR